MKAQGEKVSKSLNIDLASMVVNERAFFSFSNYLN